MFHEGMDLVTLVYLEQSLARCPARWITEWVISTVLLESDLVYLLKIVIKILICYLLRKDILSKMQKKKSLLLLIYASCFLGIMPYEISVSNYLTCLIHQLRKKKKNLQ